MHKVSIIIPGRNEQYMQKTVDFCLKNARGDIEVIPVKDGPDGFAPLKEDPRVKPLYLEKALGQRVAYNLGVKKSTGKYVMKIDAHALVSPGFDVDLQENCPYGTTVLPEMRRLNIHKWEPKKTGATWFMYPGLDLYCHYWRHYRKRLEAQEEYPEVMTGQGSCWFMTREWNDYIGLLDPGVGSWGNVGIEVSLRTWLCGGSQILNKKAWQAHWFRVSEGRFPYPFSGRQVKAAHDYTWKNYYFNDHAFEHQTRPFKWLIDKFAPVPSWEVYATDEYKASRVIVYYTDNKIEGSLAASVRKHLLKVVGPIPIISVSQEPLDFGTNICVGSIGHDYMSMYKQILAGAEAAPENSIIYLCEHDVFYHFSHFAKVPNDKRAFYFNRNRYYWWVGDSGFYKAGTNRAFSHAIIAREYLIDHLKGRLKNWIPRFKARRHNWSSERPNVDVRHSDNLTKDGRNKIKMREGKILPEFNIAGWGGPKHFQSTVKYKGTLRTDIINYLIEWYGYKSYLEIGVDKGQNFKHIDCELKHGIDPNKSCDFQMTSDNFFATTRTTYDLIFIDGLHEAEQVKTDLANSLTRINPGGVVVMHDCNPRNEYEQQVPKESNQRIWTGDVWKAFVEFRQRKDLEMYVVDTNNGIGIVRPGQLKPIELLDELTFANLEAKKDKWLNLVSVQEFKAYEQDRSLMATHIRGHEMHQNSIKIMTRFRDRFLTDLPNATILDIGARSVKGQQTYRPLFEGKYEYTGMDIAPGPNVDIVGFENIKKVYDVVISGQTMEHVKQPWEWLKNLNNYFSKYICIVAPNGFGLHRHPLDTYRYFPDGMLDLFEYAGIPPMSIYKDHKDTVGIGTKE